MRKTFVDRTSRDTIWGILALENVYIFTFLYE